MKTTYEKRWGHPRTKKVNGNTERARRKLEAEQRQAIYDELTVAEKIALCKSRRGHSARELERLQVKG